MSEQRQVEERHSTFYLDWLERCDARLKSRHQKDTLIEMAAEVDNVRAAWEWTIAQRDTACLCQAGRTLWHLFELRTWLVEGEAIFFNTAAALQSHTAENPSDDEAQVAVQSMRAYSAYFSFRLGKSAEAYAVLLPAATYLQSSTDQLAAIYALWHLGIVCWYLGKFIEVDESLQLALQKSQAQDQRWCQAVTGEFIGIVAYEQGKFDRSRRFIEEALVIDRELGDTMLIAHTLSYLSRTVQALGNYAEAERLLRESLALAREIDYRGGVGLALQDFFHQIIDDVGVAAGEGADEVRHIAPIARGVRRHLQAGNPAFGALRECGNIGG
jgi:tetratricopeptide (TPR) repeat protein